MAVRRSWAAARIFWTWRRWSSSVPWLKFKRATVNPTSIISPTRSSEAGPMVATTLVRVRAAFGFLSVLWAGAGSKMTVNKRRQD